MTDRRRIYGPEGPSCPPLFEQEDRTSVDCEPEDSNDMRPICEKLHDHVSPRPFALTYRVSDLKTGITPSASGSAYLETKSGHGSRCGSIKLLCTVHGPRSLPRVAPFSPFMILSTSVKYAPFAEWQRRGYMRDSSERDLSTQLDTAIRGVVIAERWPKSSVDIVVTIMEGEVLQHPTESGMELFTMMNVLSQCITVAAAAIADAGIDCVDTVAGGVAALVAARGPSNSEPTLVLNPQPSTHGILATCCVAHLHARDELTHFWLQGRALSANSVHHYRLVAQAIRASQAASQALSYCLREALATA